MSDDPKQQATQDNSNAPDKKTKEKNIKGTQTKREVGTKIISGTFGTLAITVAVCLHNWTFWVFIISGFLCLAICLRLGLKHLGYKKASSRNWAVILFALGLLGAYRIGCEQTQPLTNSSKSKAVDIGTNEIIKFEARLVSFDGYPPGTSIGGMPFEKGFAYLKLDVKSQNKTVKNLDVKVALEKYLSQETIFDVAQISTFTGVTCFPEIEPGPLAIQGITQNGSNYTLPLEGGLQSPLVSQAKPFGPLWRIHCEEIFHNSTMSFAIKTKNMKNPMEPWQPVEIDVLGSYDIDGSGGIHNYPVKFSFEFPKNQNRGVSN